MNARSLNVTPQTSVRPGAFVAHPPYDYGTLHDLVITNVITTFGKSMKTHFFSAYQHV